MAEHVKHLLSAWIDGELGREEQRQVADHLEDCSVCRGYADELMSIKEQLYTAYQSVEAPEELEKSVMRDIRQPQTKRQPVPGIGKWAVAVVAALLLTMIVVQMAPFVYFSASLASTMVTIVFSLLQAIPIVVSSIPYLLGTVLVGAVVLIIISGWSLHRLLETRTIW